MENYSTLFSYRKLKFCFSAFLGDIFMRKKTTTQLFFGEFAIISVHNYDIAKGHVWIMDKRISFQIT